MSSWTGYPKISGFPHMAPALGALPIPTIQRSGPPQNGMFPGAPPWSHLPPLQGLNGLGASVPGAPEVIDQATLEQAGQQSAARVTNTPETLPEVGLGIATAAFSGALTGGVAAASWRGAAIGAGLNAGLWSGFTAFNAWAELGPRTKMVLGGTAASGLGAALALYLTRRDR